MNFYGIDYDTIFSYVQRHWPWALPYIQFIMYGIPVILFVSGKIASRMPVPGYQIDLFSDQALSGKLNARWFSAIDKLVQSGNQVIILVNFILSSRIYAAMYHILGALGNRVKKADAQSVLVNPALTKAEFSTATNSIDVATADNLTAEQIHARASFLSDQLAQANTKTLRDVAAQKAVQLDTSPQVKKEGP